VGTTAGAAAVLAEIWRYPVRSLAGLSLAAVEIGASGLAGDRVWTVVADGAVLRGKDAPGLGSLEPSGDRDADEALLRAALGREVRLEALPPSPGIAPVHLVSRGARARAAEGDVPPGCSADDPRANLVLDLADDERTWVGRRIAVGEVVLEVTRTPKHCLGVYAEVRRGGRVAVGDPVTLQP
jgi:uncharacterized protein